MGILKTLMHPYTAPVVGKALQLIDPVHAKLDRTVRKYIDPEAESQKASTYTNPFTGETVKYKRGGNVKKLARGGGIESKGKTKGKCYATGGKVSTNDLTPRSNLPDKNAVEQRAEIRKQAKAAPKPKPDAKMIDNAVKRGAIREYARGGRIDGCATKGKTKGRFI